MNPVERLTEPTKTVFPAEWYDFAHPYHFWLTSRQRALRAMLNRLGIDRAKPMHVIDIGTGNGASALLIERDSAWTVDGVDLDERAFVSTDRRRGRLLAYDITERRPELANAFDAAVLFDVIEHVADPVTFLRAAAYHLRPEGWLFINVPAFSLLFSRYDEVNGHYRRYSRANLAAEIEAADIELIESQYWGFSLLPVVLARNVAVKFVSDEKVIDRGFTPPSPFINRTLDRMMAVEQALMSRPPAGTSAMAVARKRRA